jgi:glycogen debranching enzyme
VSRALDWIECYGDKDGDGYVEYDRRNSQGLINQGWKDSWDGVSFADGRLAEAPIALCEVQAYVYAAYLAGAHFALEAGDHDNMHRYQQKAVDLKLAFNRDFWLEDHGWFAVGLDAHKEPIDALTSNIGHCLWTGIADEDKAAQVADQLLRPEMFSGWGIRTLATTMARYNPVSYHNGSVWPHDTAICVAGLTRYGHLEHAHRVTQAMLDVSEHFDGRLPELFAGIGRDELSAPAPYPASCSPQAWAAAAPLLLVRSMMRLDPWARRNQIHVNPRPPRSIERLDLHGVRINDRKLDFHWRKGKLHVDGLDGMDLLHFAHPATQMTEWGE